jgi:hypothetical protein
MSRRRWGRTQTRRLRSGASRTVCLLFLLLAAALYGTLMLRVDELFASDVAVIVASEQVLPHPYGKAAAARDGGKAAAARDGAARLLSLTSSQSRTTSGRTQRESNAHSAASLEAGVVQRRAL